MLRSFALLATFDFYRIFFCHEMDCTRTEKSLFLNMIGYFTSRKESKCRSRKSRTSSTFSVSQKTVQPNQKSLVQRYFNHPTHALTKSS